jgi:hypothetical protein
MVNLVYKLLRIRNDINAIEECEDYKYEDGYLEDYIYPKNKQLSPYKRKTSLPHPLYRSKPILSNGSKTSFYNPSDYFCSVVVG